MTTRTQFHLEILNAYDAQRREVDDSEYGRLERGLMLALHDSVSFTANGAAVTSQKKQDKVYDVQEGDCNCLDSRAPHLFGQKRCKHQWSVWMVEDALDALTAPAPASSVPFKQRPPQDLELISVISTPDDGIFCRVWRNHRSIFRINVSYASLARISTLVRRWRRAPGWRVDPIIAAYPGWTLERT